MHPPNIWGPIYWNSLNSVVMNYPITPNDTDKANMKSFFLSFGNILPCEKCRGNYAKHLEQLPLTDNVLSSRTNLIKWLVDIHNEVNKSTGKRVLSYEEGVKCIVEQYEGQGENVKWLFTIIIAIVFVIMLLVGGYLKWIKNENK